MRPTEILIDLAALRHNYRVACSLSPIGKPIAVVKANAYGHGVVPVAQTLGKDVDTFAVACLEEAKILREHGITQPILLLEGCFTPDEYKEISTLDCQPVIHNSEQLQPLFNAVLTKPITVWLKIDTGMHRLGVQPAQFAHFVQQLQNCQCVAQINAMSHFSCADELDNDATLQQLALFEHTVTQVKGFDSAGQTSLANSAAIMAWPQTKLHRSRAGIMLYGISPFIQPVEQAEQLQQVMTLRSRVIALRQVKAGQTVGYGNHWQATRDSMIATVAVGYGDGYPRNAKSGTPVLIKQQRGKLAGRVSMDMICVDVTDIREVKVGDEAVMWGDGLAVTEVAQWADTIAYELVTRMPTRVKKIYNSAN